MIYSMNVMKVGLNLYNYTYIIINYNLKLQTRYNVHFIFKMIEITCSNIKMAHVDTQNIESYSISIDNLILLAVIDNTTEYIWFEVGLELDF